MAHHDAGQLPADWLGYGVSFGTDQKLYFAEWRGGFTVHQARSMFFEVQELRTLRRDALRVAADMAALQARVDDAEKKTAFYRAQLSLESRMGAMLGRIAGPL